LLLCLCFSLGLAGCFRPPAPPAVLPIESVEATELQNAGNLLSQRKYREAENAYRKILTSSPAPAADEAAEAHYAIAVILTYNDNPHRNYAQAIRELDDFLRLHPGDTRVRDAQNLRFMLKTIIDIKKENERLSKSIEQLKLLDIRQEELRGDK